MESIVPVSLIAYERCAASHISGAIDLLHSANAVAVEALRASVQPFVYQVLSIDGASVRSATGYPVAVDAPVAVHPIGGIVFLPAIEPADVFETVASQTRLIEWLGRQYAQGATLAAAGTAVVLLAEAGLLDGRRSTVDWWLAEDFRRRYPRVELRAEELVVEDGRLFSSGTGMACLDLALHLIRRYGGNALAAVTAKHMALDERRSQAPYASLQHLHARELWLTRAEDWVLQHLAEPIGVEDLAQALAMSTRTLNRHLQRDAGLGPAQFVQKVRVQKAKQLLENSRLPITAIAEQVGYGDHAAFRRTFRRHSSLSPGEYRRRAAPV